MASVLKGACNGGILGYTYELHSIFCIAAPYFGIILCAILMVCRILVIMWSFGPLFMVPIRKAHELQSAVRMVLGGSLDFATTCKWAYGLACTWGSLYEASCVDSK